jgi:hypothetical protein
LREAGFCQIWIPNFSLLAKPLYEVTKWDKREPLIWKSEQQAFHAIKEALILCPCSWTPRCEKAFLPLCTWEKRHDDWSPDPIPRLMTSANGLSLQRVGFSGKGMVSLLASSRSHSLPGVRGSEVNTGKESNS